MKAKANLSAITGFFFGLISYIVLQYVGEPDAFLFAVICGLFVYLILFVFLIIHEKIMNKKYAEFEKNIHSPIFRKLTEISSSITVKLKMQIYISVKMVSL